MKNEAQTRKEIIDKRLLEAGWRVDDRSQVIQEFDIEVGLPKGVEEPKTRYQGHQFSDYVLLGRNGKLLAVVEAKKTSVDAAIGREQAKQYCLTYRSKRKGGSELTFLFLHKWARDLLLGFG
jgi:type I restriction enzyme R subunit